MAEAKEAIMTGKFHIITRKNFDALDETRLPFEKGRLDVITVGGLTLYRETLERDGSGPSMSSPSWVAKAASDFM